jgi:hypothetical protein
MGVIDAMIGESTSAESSEAADTFSTIYKSETSSIYFAFSDLVSDRKNSTPLGQPWNLLAIQDFSFLGLEGTKPTDLIDVNIAYVEDVKSGQSALAIDIMRKGDEDYTTKFFASTKAPYVDEGQLVIEMSDSLTLRTWDIDKDDLLMPVIQFRLYQTDSDGNEFYLGKISTLVGYGN